MQDLCIPPAALAEERIHSHRRRIARQIERLWRQTANLAFAEPGPSGNEVHQRPIWPGNSLDAFPGLSGGNEARQFFGRQRSPTMAPISFSIEHLQFSQRISR